MCLFVARFTVLTLCVVAEIRLALQEEKKAELENRNILLHWISALITSPERFFRAGFLFAFLGLPCICT